MCPPGGSAATWSGSPTSTPPCSTWPAGHAGLHPAVEIRPSNLDKKTIREYRDDDGIVNEFALIYHLRHTFPLHFTVFKQTASHLPHEGNSEQLFSRSGSLSDDNGKMDPARLAVWTSIGVNYTIYKPTDKQILERYMLKFSKGGKATAAEMHADDLGLLDPEEAEEGEA